MFNFRPQLLLLYLIVGGIVLALYNGDPNWEASAKVLRDGVVVTWLVSLLNIVVGNGLGRLLGIRPRHLLGLLGIVFSPFLHRDIGHLIANTVPFLVLGWLILLQDKIQGSSDFYVITASILLIGEAGHLDFWSRCDSFGGERSGVWLHWLFASGLVRRPNDTDAGLRADRFLDVRQSAMGNAA